MRTRNMVQVLLMCTSGFAQLYFHRLIMIWAITLKSILVFSTIRAQSSLSIFAQKYLHNCEEIYFSLQNKYLCIYEYSFGAKIL